MSTHEKRSIESLYKKGMDRLRADEAMQGRLLKGLPAGRPRSAISRLAPVLCGGVCALCVLLLSVSLLPVLRNSLVAEGYKGMDSSLPESSEPLSSPPEEGFLLLSIGEEEGLVSGTLLSNEPETQGAGQNASGLLVNGSPLPLAALETALIESGSSGIVVAVPEKSLEGAALSETAEFLSELDASPQFTVLSVSESLLTETEDSRRAWAQVALTRFLRGRESILLSGEACLSLSSPLLRDFYPLSGSYGLPERDGSLHTGVTYRVSKEETLLSPMDGTVVYAEKGAAVVYAEGTYAAVSGMKEIYLGEGEAVSAGEVLGEAPGGDVYLSVLSHGRFVNPSSRLLEVFSSQSAYVAAP